MIVGSVIPFAFVNTSDSASITDIKDSILSYMIWQAVFYSVVFWLTLLFMKNGPKNSPQEILQTNGSDDQTGKNTYDIEPSDEKSNSYFKKSDSLCVHIKYLFGTKLFLLYFVIYSIGMGVLKTMSLVIVEIIRPYGYEQIVGSFVSIVTFFAGSFAIVIYSIYFHKTNRISERFGMTFAGGISSFII